MIRPDVLAPQSKCLDNIPIALHILVLYVVEQSSPLAHQHQESPAGMMVFFVGFQVLGQIRNTMGQQSYLDFW